VVYEPLLSEAHDPCTRYRLLLNAACLLVLVAVGALQATAFAKEAGQWAILGGLCWLAYVWLSLCMSSDASALRNHMPPMALLQLTAQLRATPQTCRADDGPMRQIGERFDRRPGDQRVARVFARQHRHNPQPFGQKSRHVFHRMDSQVDRLGDQRFFDFFGEQALAARFRERAVLDAIAGRFDDHDGNGAVRRQRRMCGRQQALGFVCLP
jgi:hypothetical protein